MKTLIAILGIAAMTLIAGQSSAAVIAATNFNGRVASPSNTATGLNWTTNGVNNPGNMAALNAASAAQALFDTTALTQNNFTPGLNTGNGDTFWTTDISITVTSGFNVTLTDVVFDYIAVSSGQALNTDRRSDFTVTLYNPSAVQIDAVNITDAISGTTAIPTLTATFTAPIALTAPGTYTLRIKGGDFLGTNETGNHTGIDNLSINGSFAPVPEPACFTLLGLGLAGLCLRRHRE